MEPKSVSTLEDLHRELWKSWRYRFWYRAYAPRYWIKYQMIRFRIWRKRRGDNSDD